MNRDIIAILLLLFISSLNLFGQTDSSVYRVISGKIIDDSLAYALPSVHLWNESTRMGTISNDSGEFSIHAKSQDTLVFTRLGYSSKVILAPTVTEQDITVRLKAKSYEIDEVVVRRFRSYESFLYQVVHLDLPESEIEQTRDNLMITSTAAALDADMERNARDKARGFGVTTPLGPGIDHEKAFKEKVRAMEKRKRVIEAKFNRAMVGDLTKLEGDELTEFIALCNFNEDYLYETDLYAIVQALNQKFYEYLGRTDSIPSDLDRN